jgi:uncharacterized protein YbaR (Trm112 family)
VRLLSEDVNVRKNVVLVCIYCKQEFPLGEGAPVPGRQGFFLCPYCRKATPLFSRKTAGKVAAQPEVWRE